MQNLNINKIIFWRDGHGELQYGGENCSSLLSDKDNIHIRGVEFYHILVGDGLASCSAICIFWSSLDTRAFLWTNTMLQLFIKKLWILHLFYIYFLQIKFKLSLVLFQLSLKYSHLVLNKLSLNHQLLLKRLNLL